MLVAECSDDSTMVPMPAAQYDMGGGASCCHLVPQFLDAWRSGMLCGTRSACLDTSGHASGSAPLPEW